MNRVGEVNQVNQMDQMNPMDQMKPMNPMTADSRIYVAGHSGLVGSALSRALKLQGYNQVIERTHTELDLTEQAQVADFFRREKPDYVFLAAARVGGIAANSRSPAEFFTENALIQSNVIKSAWENKVKRLLFLGCSCMYPRNCSQPIKEEYLLTGPVEPTNEAYALAKICGIKMCQFYNTQYGTRYISVIPANLYGPCDNFDPSGSHVIPGLIHKLHHAKTHNEPSVELWGSGSAVRDFLYVEDMVEAALFVLQNYEGNEPVNIGTGQRVSIKELAELAKEITNYPGVLKFDTAKPDGAPIRVLDVAKLTKIGWKYQVELREGLRRTYDYFKEVYGLGGLR